MTPPGFWSPQEIEHATGYKRAKLQHQFLSRLGIRCWLAGGRCVVPRDQSVEVRTERKRLNLVNARA